MPRTLQPVYSLASLCCGAECSRVCVMFVDMAAKKKQAPKSSAAKMRMAEEKSKKKPVRADSQGRTGMGASASRKPGRSKAEMGAWAAAPELMALGAVISKVEKTARKAMFGSRYAGDPGEKPSRRKNK